MTTYAICRTAEEIRATPECDAEQAAQWQERFTEGYRVGRGDARWNASPRIPLIEIPPEDPHETGARYVTRCLPIAWEIGYTRAYTYETTR